MTCIDARARLEAFRDRELDPFASREVERHLAECPSCRGALAGIDAVSHAVRGAARFRPPATLERRLRRELRREAGDGTPSVLRWTAVATAIAAALVLGILVLPRLGRREDPSVRDAIAGHVRAVVTGHLVDVTSSDQHTVRPWLSARLDFSPPVKDGVEHGFPLVGGRLDYLDERPVAVLVFRRRQHLISVFARPSRDGARPATVAGERNGYRVVTWSTAEVRFTAVSDTAAEDLVALSTLGW